LPNFYYWSVNQFITQRTLAARNLREGQLGIIFASFLKLITPFIIVFPGIMAWQLFKNQMTGIGGTDAALPTIIRNVIPNGFLGFIFAAIGGAVISSLASMLNSASTIFTMDIYKWAVKKELPQSKIVLTGRISTLVFLILGCLIAPILANPALKGIFTYLQEFQGFISPGILAAFAFGLIFKRAPKAAGLSALILNPIIYGILLVFCGSLPVFAGVQIAPIAFLNRMAITFIIIVAIMALITLIKPLEKPVTMPERKDFNMQSSPIVKWFGAIIVATVIILYIIFW
jgi:SSS family solute:Na+ symporter